MNPSTARRKRPYVGVVDPCGAYWRLLPAWSSAGGGVFLVCLMCAMDL
ncbi:hypothetical protein [Streptomyces incarnatus]|nr:hypothetical protein [Streptomyces incarnatus]